MEYSSIKLKANKDLGLQGIWLKTNDPPAVRTQHIIVIEGNGQNTPSKSVFSQSINCSSEDSVLKHLSFEEQHLEAGRKYQIKVEKPGSEMSPNEVARKHKPDKQRAILILPNQIGLEVTGKKANDCIVCLSVRLGCPSRP